MDQVKDRFASKCFPAVGVGLGQSHSSKINGENHGSDPLTKVAVPSGASKDNLARVKTMSLEKANSGPRFTSRDSSAEA